MSEVASGHPTRFADFATLGPLVWPEATAGWGEQAHVAFYPTSSNANVGDVPLFRSEVGHPGIDVLDRRHFDHQPDD